MTHGTIISIVILAIVLALPPIYLLELAPALLICAVAAHGIP